MNIIELCIFKILMNFVIHFWILNLIQVQSNLCILATFTFCKPLYFAKEIFLFFKMQRFLRFECVEHSRTFLKNKNFQKFFLKFIWKFISKKFFKNKFRSFHEKFRTFYGNRSFLKTFAKCRGVKCTTFA